MRGAVVHVLDFRVQGSMAHQVSLSPGTRAPHTLSAPISWLSPTQNLGYSSTVGIAALGCPNAFVFVDGSTPTFQWVVTELPIEGQLFSHCAFSP